jgi:predicted O-methyltransferase YrrM
MNDSVANSRMSMMAANFMKNPAEFVDRIINTAELYYHTYLHKRPNYDSVKTFEETLKELGEYLSRDLGKFLEEDEYQQITKHVLDSYKRPDVKAVHGHFNAELDLGRLCYVLCRSQKPEKVVETGVANGATSCFILQALEKNGVGELYSIDLPPLAVYGGSEVGTLVPGYLRPRWHLKFGSSRRVMPPLLKDLGAIDMFVHDSLHSYHNVKRELAVASKRLASNGIVVVDNIAGNSAFTEWSKKHSPGFDRVVREGKSILGFALK